VSADASPRGLMRLGAWTVIVALALVAVLGIGLRVAVEALVPSVDILHIDTPQVAMIGGPLRFRVEGEQRPGCVVRAARFLRYRDGNTLVPLTDVTLPNIAVANSLDRDVDQTANSQTVIAHFVIPLPKTYVMPGVARLEIQTDDAPCGYLHGLLSAHVHHLEGPWMTILPAKGD
jgi:hypothetical protein